VVCMSRVNFFNIKKYPSMIVFLNKQDSTRHGKYLGCLSITRDVRAFLKAIII
jgi:hypothetical protein